MSAMSRVGGIQKILEVTESIPDKCSVITTMWFTVSRIILVFVLEIAFYMTPNFWP